MHADHRALLFQFEKYIPHGRIHVAEDLALCQRLHQRPNLHVNGGLLMVDWKTGMLYGRAPSIDGLTDEAKGDHE